MSRGDHIRVSRPGYFHHGIDCGDGYVIHYTGEIGQKSNASICKEPLQNFANGVQVETMKYDSCRAADDVIQRANSRIGEENYSLFFNNCEHFARWCKTGEAQSEQVRTGVSAVAGASGTGAAVAGSIGVVGAAGAVAGLSGAGIMSGLATVGGVVGMGAVGGIAVLGAAPGVISTVAMGQVLKDDKNLPESERNARQAGRIASTAGMAAGTAGAIATISAAGSVAGLSGAGISTGLAAIGGTVGGGMAAGVAITVAAPAAAAAVVGYGVYKLWRWLSN